MGLKYVDEKMHKRKQLLKISFCPMCIKIQSQKYSKEKLKIKRDRDFMELGNQSQARRELKIKVIK